MHALKSIGNLRVGFDVSGSTFVTK